MKKTSVQKIKQLFDIITSTYIVMSLFFKYPRTDFTLSEIAKNTGLSKATLSKIINHLRSVGFITVLDLEVIYRIRANLDNPIFRREKIAFNISSIIRSNIPELLVQKFHNPKCIIMF